jgi:hypothetical protein
VTAGQALLAVLGVIGALVLGYALWMSWDVTPAADISQLLTQNPENYRLALGHMSDLTVDSFAALRIPAAAAAVSLSVGTVFAWLLRRRQRALAASLITALTTACFIWAAHLALDAFDPYLSSKSLAVAIRERLAPGDVVVINGEYQGGSSIGFYLPEKVLLLNGRMTGLEFGSYYPDAPPVFIDNAEIARLWQGPKRIFLFVHDDKYTDVVKHLPGDSHRIAAAGGKAVYSNRL